VDRDGHQQHHCHFTLAGKYWATRRSVVPLPALDLPAWLNRLWRLIQKVNPSSVTCQTSRSNPLCGLELSCCGEIGINSVFHAVATEFAAVAAQFTDAAGQFARVTTQFTDVAARFAGGESNITVCETKVHARELDVHVREKRLDARSPSVHGEIPRLRAG
jgi:hypothetical protein